VGIAAVRRPRPVETVKSGRPGATKNVQQRVGI